MTILQEAYKIIFGQEPLPKQEEWQLAREILNNFAVAKLGEELAKRVIFEVVNHTIFPSQQETIEIVGHAENLATELFDEFNRPGVEPHMDEIAYLEYKSKNK